MAILRSKEDPTAASEVERALRSARVSPRPAGAIGYYRTAWCTPTTNMVGTGYCFGMRWSRTDVVALITYARVVYTYVSVSNTYSFALSLSIFRNATISGSPTTYDPLPLRSEFPASQATVIVGPFNVTGYSGSDVLCQGALVWKTVSPSAGWTASIEPLSYPVVLSGDMTVALPVPASGAYRTVVELEWAEVNVTDLP